MTSSIIQGDTLKAAELSNCQDHTTTSLIHQDGRTRINAIYVYLTSCANLKEHVENFTYELLVIATPVTWILEPRVYDHSNYFLPNTEFNTTVDINSNSTNETLYVCLLSLWNYYRLQNTETAEEHLDIVQDLETDCVKMESDSLTLTRIIDMAGYYFWAIISVTEAEPRNLDGQCTVSIVRHFYDRDDFLNNEVCNELSSTNPCAINNLDYNTTSNCVVLYADIDPEDIFFDNVSTIAEAVPWTKRNELKIPTSLSIIAVCVLILSIVLVCYCGCRHYKGHNFFICDTICTHAY